MFFFLRFSCLTFVNTENLWDAAFSSNDSHHGSLKSRHAEWNDLQGEIREIHSRYAILSSCRCYLCCVDVDLQLRCGDLSSLWGKKMGKLEVMFWVLKEMNALSSEETKVCVCGCCFMYAVGGFWWAPAWVLLRPHPSVCASVNEWLTHFHWRRKEGKSQDEGQNKDDSNLSKLSYVQNSSSQSPVKLWSSEMSLILKFRKLIFGRLCPLHMCFHR